MVNQNQILIYEKLQRRIGVRLTLILAAFILLGGVLSCAGMDHAAVLPKIPADGIKKIESRDPEPPDAHPEVPKLPESRRSRLSRFV
jgi:hypothetical protein